MQDCACVISFAPHFTFLWKGDLQLKLKCILTWEIEKGKSLCG